MIVKQLIGMSGSLFGLVFPSVMLLATGPPIGFHAVGGYPVLSVFLLEASRPRQFWLAPDDIIAPKKVDCPGGELGPRLALRESPLPGSPPGQRPYAGLTACLLVSPAGQVIRVVLVDGEGRRVSRPDIATIILADWRFEASPDSRPRLAWHPIPLEGRQAIPQAAMGEMIYSL
jgi:hypothetical protein